MQSSDPIAKISAIVVAGNPDGTNKAIEEEAALTKKEGAEWSLEKLTWSKGDTKESKYMKVASNPDSYAVPQYFDYVPVKDYSTTR